MFHLGPLVIMGKDEHLALLEENKALAADIAALTYCIEHGIPAGRIGVDASGGYLVGPSLGVKSYGFTYSAALSAWLNRDGQCGKVG